MEWITLVWVAGGHEWLLKGKNLLGYVVSTLATVLAVICKNGPCDREKFKNLCTHSEK